ncbi:uncharacterized protein ACNLHF_023702 isoform 5-T5 [Anomaloglossus baeobatrachus]
MGGWTFLGYLYPQQRTDKNRRCWCYGIWSLTYEEEFTCPLYVTASRGYTDCLRLLLQRGADVDFTPGGESALHGACENGHNQCVQLLLKHGANPNIQSQDGFSPLHHCKTPQSYRCAQLLLKYGAHVAAPSEDEALTPLHIAAGHGLMEHVELYLHSGAAMESRDVHGETPLSVACSHPQSCQQLDRYFKVCQRLIDCGADIHTRDNDQQSPLHLACKSVNPQTVELLLQHGAEVNAMSYSGNTAMQNILQVTAYKRQHEPEVIVRALLNHGAIRVWPGALSKVLRFCCSSPRTVEVLLNTYSNLRGSEDWAEVVPEEEQQVKGATPTVLSCWLLETSLPEEMDSDKNWNKEPKDCEGKMTSSLLEKEHLPKLKTSFYVMGSTFLLLCFISVIVYMLHQGTIANDVNERTREIQHSRRPRGSDTWNLLTENITDDSVEITGNICMGYGTKCCIELHFIHDTDIILHAIAGPKTRFTQLQGEYVHNNKTGTWECSPTDVLYWNIEIRGDEPAVWSGDITNDMIARGKFGRSKTEILLKTQVFGKILDPSLLSITEGDKDWVKTWNFQITREPVQVQVSVVFTVTNTIVPEIRVSPQTVHNKVNTLPIMLKCNTRLKLPSESLLTWIKNSSFLGSFLNSPTNVIHRGQIGNIRWMDDNFIFYIENPSSRDSGIYQCCVETKTHYRHCKDVSVNIWSVTDNACTNTRFMPSTPFQINQFQSKSLLRDGEFMTMVWTFNMSHWKISTRFPQCQSHLINMEMGIEQWFGKRTTQTRSKRGVLEGILGGIGTVGSLTNAMNIQTLKSDLDNIGFIGGKGVKVQKSLNQLLEKMVMNTAAVLGSSVSHLQDATLALVESTHETQVAKACLEIQVEYSSNLKLIAQALQSGITPLGILRNLPVEYDFALNHTDLWVNKWLGCEQNICVGTSLIPVIGREGTIVPVTVLGIPVSNTQQVFYQLQYTDFAFDGVNTEQVDISSCLHFVSKVMCLPGQDKVIYHSCFHNHSSCHARIETVQTIHDLVTPVSPNKICFQVMSETEKVSVFYSTCVHKENLPMGLYCIEGNVRALSKKEGSFNITSIGKRNLTAFPIQFN